MRLGILGGSFDPVHNGHLLLAECCRDQALLHEVWFLPAAVQPHKPHGPVASDSDRVEMLRLATRGREGMTVCPHEIDRGGVSYTVDTLRHLHAEQPDAEFFFLMGADTLHDLPNWRDPAEVLRLATPLVVQRPGEPEPNFGLLKDLADGQQLETIRQAVVEMPPTDISSSEIRRRLAAAEPCADDLPPRVWEFLDRRGIYRERQ